ncbi:hypothetical protein L1049_013574 [Liquidambar formosana]|uniref:RING-type domain-containing protein n=1 Tax=Liquidambar formosana TaxID=63359 RepID=A0AAP0RKJ1_LIQFO
MGFDNECILNIQSLAGEYFCPVCRLLVYPNEALQSQCTHLYCKPCLTYVVSTTRACPYDGYLVTEADSKPLTESNKTLAETIGKIAVHCLYHRSGCTWQGPLSDCTSHCSGCAFGNSPVVCNRCGIQIVHRQVQEHAQNCPGVQPQAQQGEGVQDTAATGTAATADQTQAAIQAGTTTTQAQTSQTTAVITAVQDPNQQANSIPQGPAVAQAAVPTPEQWYQQQQQQYQQYYQQYPGYDPYQQHYQQYYPYQQQAAQQYQQQHVQAQTAHVPGQHPPQAYMQPQPQPQLQPQPQVQPQAQAHVQPQAQSQAQAQPQPQPQLQPHAQPQLHPQVQAPTAAQHQNQPQVNPAVQPHSHAPQHGQLPPQPQQYPQAQPHPMQPHAQPHPQMPLYQQPHSQMQHPQPQIQPQPHPQHHPLPLSQPHSQAQPQAQIQHHPQHQPQPQPQTQTQLHSSQTSQPPNPNVQPQAQHPSAHAVTSHHSYPQPQAHQQLQLGAPQQQHPMHPHLQHPIQMQNQFPQQPAQMRPPQSHAPVANQQQPALLPSPGQVPNIPPAQQLPVHPHAQQPAHSVHQRPVMQPNQQAMPHNYMQQQQLPFPGQPSGSVQNQLHQQGPFVQPHQLPMQSHLRSQGPPPSLQQNSHAYPQLQQNVGMQSYPSQNHFGRPMVPGVQSQPFPHSPGGIAGAGQARPMMLGANQPSTNQNYPFRTNNQVQLSSEQQSGFMQQSSNSQSGPILKSTMLDRQGDQLSEKSVVEREFDSSSQRASKNDANNLATASGLGAGSVEMKTVKSETDTKSMDDEHKPIVEDEDKTGQASKSAGQTTDPKSHTMGDGEPVIKQMVKEEITDSTLEQSDENVAEEQKDVLKIVSKQVDHSSLEDKEIQEQAEVLEEQSGKLQNDASGVMPSSTGTDKGSQAVPPVSTPTSAQSIIPKGPIPDSERKMLHQQVTPQDEYRGFPPPGQVQGRGFVQPSHYGPSLLQQRPAAPSMLQAMAPSGPLHHGQVPGHPPSQLRPQGPGQLAQPGQPLNPPDHFQPPGGIPGPGSAASFGRGPGHFGPPQRNFEVQSVAPQGHYNQGPVPPTHPGPPRVSQGEPVGGPSQGALPPGSFDSHGGMMARAPPYGPEGQMGQQHLNPMEADLFPNRRHGYLDGRHPDSHLPGSVERGPFVQPSGIQLNAARMNGAPGLDSSLALGLRDERFKPLTEEHLNPFSTEPGRRIIDRGDFEDDLKQFPRPSRMDGDPIQKFGSYFSSSRPIDRGPHGFGADAARAFDKAPHGFNYDSGLKLDPGASSAPSRFLPPYHPGGTFRPNDAGERPRPVGIHEDNVGRPDSARNHPDFLGPVTGYGRHHMDGLTPRSPVGEYHGIPSRGFGSGGPGSQSGLDDIDGRELRRFGEGSKPFNLPSDPIGNSFHESRFPILPGHLRRGELDGSVNLPMGEHIESGPHNHLRSGDLISQDILPSHLRRVDHLGPRNLPGHLRLGEPAGFGAFHGHARIGELAGPGNFPQHLSTGEPFGVGNRPNHPRFGEPGFRSSYSLQGYPNDGGFYAGDRESFDNPRKRKTASMGWCRICKFDCETVEGLDLHSQTREHQKMAMDMVLNIKQQNAKKQKLASNDHSSVEDASKSRNVSFEGRCCHVNGDGFLEVKFRWQSFQFNLSFFGEADNEKAESSAEKVYCLFGMW